MRRRATTVRRGGFLGWLGDLLTGLGMTVIVIVVLSRVVAAHSGEATPRAGRELPWHRAPLEQVLDDSSLPPAFSFSGLTWQAVDSAATSGDHLEVIGSLSEGYPVYRPRRVPKDSPRELYMRALRLGWRRHLYIRYVPVGG